MVVSHHQRLQQQQQQLHQPQQQSACVRGGWQTVLCRHERWQPQRWLQSSRAVGEAGALAVQMFVFEDRVPTPNTEVWLNPSQALNSVLNDSGGSSSDGGIRSCRGSGSCSSRWAKPKVQVRVGPSQVWSPLAAGRVMAAETAAAAALCGCIPNVKEPWLL